MPGLWYFWDYTYILIIIGAVICGIASARVRTTYNRYAEYQSRSGMTGAQAAVRILQSQGIYDVEVQQVSGYLTDHYDPRNKVLSLSESTFGSTSVAAVGVAAHECGHAAQHARGYVPLKIRGAMVPLVNFGSGLSWPLIIIGFFMNYSWGSTTVGTYILQAGIILFSLVVLFQLVTLPVEFNASHRALKILDQQAILDQDELVYTRRVLRAAALTYVASAAAALLQLLRILLLARSND